MSMAIDQESSPAIRRRPGSSVAEIPSRRPVSASPTAPTIRSVGWPSAMSCRGVPARRASRAVAAENPGGGILLA